MVVQWNDNAFVKVDYPVVAASTLKLWLALHLILGHLLFDSPILWDRRSIASDHGLLVCLYYHHIIVFSRPLEHHAVIDKGPLWGLVTFCLLLYVRPRSIIMKI